MTDRKTKGVVNRTGVEGLYVTEESLQTPDIQTFVCENMPFSLGSAVLDDAAAMLNATVDLFQIGTGSRNKREMFSTADGNLVHRYGVGVNILGEPYLMAMQGGQEPSKTILPFGDGYGMIHKLIPGADDSLKYVQAMSSWITHGDVNSGIGFVYKNSTSLDAGNYDRVAGIVFIQADAHGLHIAHRDVSNPDSTVLKKYISEMDLVRIVSDIVIAMLFPDKIGRYSIGTYDGNITGGSGMSIDDLFFGIDQLPVPDGELPPPIGGPVNRSMHLSGNVYNWIWNADLSQESITSLKDLFSVILYLRYLYKEGRIGLDYPISY